MAKLSSINPATGAVVGEVDVSTDSEIQDKVRLANDARLMWKELGVENRIEHLKEIHNILSGKREEIAELITSEMGKPLKESREEVKNHLAEFEFMFKGVVMALSDEVTQEDDKALHRIVFEPWGTASVITPWNFPFGMAMWGIVPNLLAGNTVVFKISEECPLMGKLIEEVFSSLPEGVFSAVHGGGGVGQKLAESDVDLIWFTGSSKAGQLLYKIAADKFIPVVLEMGGSNPCVVFDDPDLDIIYNERFWNCGQVCDAIKRLIVHESLFDDVVGKLKSVVESKVVGGPLDEKTDISCLSARRQLDLLDSQVKDAIEKGAKVITGGRIIEDKFYAPTILTNINKDMRVWNEEVFGPVLPIISFKTDDEAIELANDTQYGLGARIFCSDKEKGRYIASRIKAGSIEVNGASRWIPQNPFGGYKKSGMGREHGILGLRQLCQVKVVAEEK